MYATSALDYATEIIDDETDGGGKSIKLSKLDCLPPGARKSKNIFDDVPKEVLADAMSALKALTKAFPQTKATRDSEPLYRALLLLQEYEYSKSDKRLLPVLQKLANLYDERGKYDYSLTFLNWMMSILEKAESTGVRAQ